MISNEENNLSRENTQNRKSPRFDSIGAVSSARLCYEAVPLLGDKLHVRNVPKVTVDKHNVKCVEIST